jgi:hypothetical protein
MPGSEPVVDEFGSAARQCRAKLLACVLSEPPFGLDPLTWGANETASRRPAVGRRDAR